MTPRIVAGSAQPCLARRVAEQLRTEAVACELERFPDGELRPVVGPVRGEDVYVVQSTGPPVNEHFVELLLELDACRRAGAERLTAVVPYFGYARQDRRSREGQAVGARVVATALAGAGAQRLVVVDPHTRGLEAMCDIPVETLSAVPAVADALAPAVSEQAVVVAPDLGAVKLAERYAARLGGLSVAVVRKSRISGTTVEATDLVGEVRGRPVVIVDDMVSTGATIEAALQVLDAHGVAPDIAVAATHGLMVGDATRRLGVASVRRLVLSDTLPVGPAPGLSLEIVSVAPLLADAVGRLQRGEDLADLLLGG